MLEIPVYHTPHLQASLSSTPDVAGQLKDLVARMQAELGGQEVEITRECSRGITGSTIFLACGACKGQGPLVPMKCLLKSLRDLPWPTGVIGQGGSGVVYQVRLHDAGAMRTEHHAACSLPGALRILCLMLRICKTHPLLDCSTLQGQWRGLTVAVKTLLFT